MSLDHQETLRDVDFVTEAEKIDRREQSLDDALRGTFPASDPPAALAPHCSQMCGGPANALLEQEAKAGDCPAC